MLQPGRHRGHANPATQPLVAQGFMNEGLGLPIRTPDMYTEVLKFVVVCKQSILRSFGLCHGMQHAGWEGWTGGTGFGS